MASTYRHTQIGYLVITALALAIAAVASVFPHRAPAHSLVPALAVLVVCLVLFSTLTTEVNAHKLRCSFGPGLIRREIDLQQITAVSVVRNPWYYGWGLRLIPGGWLWNVSGLDAVEIKFTDGRLFRIGTDEPDRLYRAITDHTGAG